MKTFKLLASLTIALCFIQAWGNKQPIEKGRYLSVKGPNRYRFEYSGRYTASIKKEKLSEAKTIGEIVPDAWRSLLLPAKEHEELKNQIEFVKNFPGFNINSQKSDYYKIADYLIDFVSVEISSVNHGKIMTVKSPDDVLTIEQISILNTSDLGTDIDLKIKFKYKYHSKDSLSNKGIEGGLIVTVVPDTEAQYPGGYKEMTKYLNEKVFDKVSDKVSSEEIRQGIVKFAIDEEGKVVDARIFISAEPKIDKLLIDAIVKMPKWKPAKNSKGEKVKQEFMIPLGGGGC